MKQISHYLSLLESNGTQPYIQLAKELQKLPDLTNATAVAKITFLALNATNSEVKEAFELMIKGGTPDPKDFGYSVPNYNTKLQILYWLACQNELKKDDTLALAIAIVNGLWVTMGDDQVKQAVYTYTNGLLDFYRETNELQKTMGYNALENHPLEVMLLLAWTSNTSQVFGTHSLVDSTYSKLDLKGFRWNILDLDTLRKMREFSVKQGWMGKNVYDATSKLETYFRHNGEHWDYVTIGSSGASKIMVDGESVPNYHFGNVVFLFKRLLEQGARVIEKSRSFEVVF